MEVQSVLVDIINVDRETRQRRELTDITDLADSIRKNGLINPITIDRDYTLIAGERRYMACKSMGFTHISAHFIDELDEHTRIIIELEENIRRERLPWRDRCLAVLRFHNEHCKQDVNWTADKTGDALQYNERSIDRHLLVGRELYDPKDETCLVHSCERFITAVGYMERQQQRRKADEKTRMKKIQTQAVQGAISLKPVPSTRVIMENKVEEEIDTELVEDEDEFVSEEDQLDNPIIFDNFVSWVEEYNDPQTFNLIHCDFPYGQGFLTTHTKANESGRARLGQYEDTDKIYLECIDALAKACDKGIVEDSAHLIFWFPIKKYRATIYELSKMGWEVNPAPLIWHKSDNAGFIPNAQRWPRMVYESAFMASRGDRKIVKLMSNCISAPTRRASKLHISEKPPLVLNHFFTLVCDQYSTVLDPTCGSGSALVAGHLRGAKTMLGIESNEEFYNVACKNLESAKNEGLKIV